MTKEEIRQELETHGTVGVNTPFGVYVVVRRRGNTLSYGFRKPVPDKATRDLVGAWLDPIMKELYQGVAYVVNIEGDRN